MNNAVGIIIFIKIPSFLIILKKKIYERNYKLYNVFIKLLSEHFKGKLILSSTNILINNSEIVLLIN
jgi:hypothetical protein